MFITITRLDDYMAESYANPGTEIILKKEPNEYDDESITVYSAKGIKYGYVANSCCSVARGTHSAGYIHHLFEQETGGIIRFRIDGLAIAELTEENIHEC